MSGRKPQPIRSKVTALLATNTKQKDIAQALHISERTVRRIAKQVAPEVEQADKLLLELQSHVTELAPGRKRVESLMELLAVAQQTKQPSAGLSIIQYFDKLMGIVTPLDRLKVEANERAWREARGGSSGDHSRPIFNIQSGAHVAVTVNNRIDDDADQELERNITPIKQDE